MSAPQHMKEAAMGGKRKAGKSMSQLAQGLARRVLCGDFQGTVSEAADHLVRAGAAQGEAFARFEAEKACRGFVIMALLCEANAVCVYPYSAREIARDLFPVWLHILAKLARLYDLRLAFLGHYA